MSNFCILPFLHTEVTNAGTVKLCCRSSEIIRDEHGNPYDVATTPLEQIWKSPHYDRVRAAFLENKRIAGCSLCWAEDDVGVESRRVKDLQVYRGETRGVLQSIDLKLGNLCNLACLICSPLSSSKLNNIWKQEFKQQYGRDGFKPVHYDWPRQANMFDTFQTIVPQLVDLHISGGEPFLIEQTWAFLQQIVDSGRAGEVGLYYNTNATIYPVSHIEIWKHFRVVSISLSLDGHEQTYEYIRNPAKWSTAQSVTQQFVELARTETNIFVDICSTISLFSFHDLGRALPSYADLGVKKIFLNLLHDPGYHSIQALPEPLKATIAESLSGEDRIQHLIGFMLAKNTFEQHRRGIATRVRMNQSIRGLSLDTVYPELLPYLA